MTDLSLGLLAILAALAAATYAVVDAMGWRLPRKHWGCEVTYLYADGNPLDQRILPARFWTKAGTEAWVRYMEESAGAESHGITTTYRITPDLPRPINPYADRYWRGDKYIGPEV